MQNKMWNRSLSPGHALKYGVYLLISLMVVMPTMGWAKGVVVGKILEVGGQPASFMLKRDGEYEYIKKPNMFLRVGDKLFASAYQCKGSLTISLSSEKRTLKCDSEQLQIEQPKQVGFFNNLFSGLMDFVSSPEGNKRVTAVSAMNEDAGVLRVPMLEKLPTGKTAILLTTNPLDGKSRKELHLRWQGGTGKYEIQVLKGENTSICEGQTEERFYTCELTQSLTAGDYQLKIMGRGGYGKKLPLSFKVVNPNQHELQCAPEWMFELYQQVANGNDSESMGLKRLLKRGEIYCN